MKKLAADDENRLLAAIEKTAMFVNDGDHPDDAIVKAAIDEGVPPGHVSALVHAYNTGRTTRQRQDGSTIFEKAADFELANTSNVLEKLYSGNVKTAAAVERSTAVSAEYQLPPSSLLARRELREKQSQAVDWRMVPKPPPEYPRDPAFILKQAYCNAERIRNEIEEARRVRQAAFYKMASTFESLSDYFRSPTSIPIPVVRENCVLLHGNKAEQLFDELVLVTPVLGKMAHHTKVASYVNREAVGEPYALVLQFFDELDRYKQASAAYDSIEKSGEARQEALLRPFDPSPRSVLDDSPLLTKTAVGGPIDTMAKGMLAANMFKQLASTVKAPESGELVTKTLDQMTDPDHEARLRQIHTQALLQDLMLNDPVISSYHPTESTQAFNDIVEMSPRTANQKLMLQSLMRQRLEQGHMDPFSIDQSLSAENKMQKRDLENGRPQNLTASAGGQYGSVIP